MRVHLVEVVKRWTLGFVGEVMLPPVKSEKEARAIVSAGLGRAELELASSFTAPLYWIIREAGGKYRVRNGSAFFLDAGAGPFGVTANHVIDGWRQDRAHGNVVALQLGLDLQLDLEGEHAIHCGSPGIGRRNFSHHRSRRSFLRQPSGCRSATSGFTEIKHDG